MNIRGQLLVVLSGVTFVSAVVGVSATVGFSSLRQSSSDLSSREFPLAIAAERIESRTLALLAVQRALTLPGTDEKFRAGQFESMDTYGKSLEELRGQLKAFLKDPEHGALITELDTALGKFQDSYAAIKEPTNKFASLQKDGKTLADADTAKVYGELVEHITKVRTAFFEVREPLRKLVEATSQHATSELQSVASRASTLTTVISLLTVLGIAASLLAAWRRTTTISQRINEISEAMSKLSLGHLNAVRVEGRGDDEVGHLAESTRRLNETLAQLKDFLTAVGKGDLTRLFQEENKSSEVALAINQMVESLRTLIGRGLSTMMEVQLGADQCANASQSLSQGATQQAAALQQISASMGEVSQKARQNSESATKAQDIASQTRTGSSEGSKKIEATVQAMSEINASGKQISNIIKVIDGIAFQTNLLALNAAVEAARAGKHGKGFAVVADEVRNLAGRSSTAAQETTALIESVVKKVEHGMAIATESKHSFEHILDMVENLTSLTDTIARGSEEQAEAANQVSSGLVQVGTVTQQTTASAEETASASMTLLSHAKQLNAALSDFRLPQTKKDKPQSPVKSETRKEAAPASTQPRPISSKPKLVSVPQAKAPLPTPAQRAPIQETWGTPPGRKPLGDSSVAAVNPAEVIALDDEEFGKYGKKS